MTFVVLAPLCVLFWRGTWQAIDCVDISIGLPKYIGPLMSAVFGHSMCFLFTLCQRPIGIVLGVNDDHKQQATCKWPVRLGLSRTYTALYAFALVNQWRGVWLLLELCVGKSWQAGAGEAAVGTVLLAATRTLRNIMAPPLSIRPDLLDNDFVRSATIFGFVPHQKKHAQWMAIVDASISVVVVSSFVVFVWRGIWIVLDANLYVGSPKRSGLGSLAIGYTVVTAACVLQRPAAALSARSSAVVRVIFEDVFLFSASFGAINVWRGVWMLADTYIYPDDYEFSNWLTSALGFGTSLLLFASNTILSRGVLLDGKLKDGSGCLFDHLYLRKIIKSSRVARVSSSAHTAHVTDERITQSKVNGDLMWKLPNTTNVADGDVLFCRDGMSLGNKNVNITVIIEQDTAV